MKKNPILLAFATTVLSVASHSIAAADVIVEYQMGQAGPQTETFVAGGDITAGANATINLNYDFGSGFPDAPVLQLDPAAGSTNTTVAQDNDRNFYFDLTVNGNVTDLDLSSFSIEGAKNGASSRAFGVGFQIDTGSGFGTRVDFVSDVGLTTERPSIASFGPYDLSGQAALQNLTAGTVVRFLIAEDNDFTASFDNIIIEGTGVVPEPSTFALVIGSLGMVTMLRRRRL